MLVMSHMLISFSNLDGILVWLPIESDVMHLIVPGGKVPIRCVLILGNFAI